jgi:hypothetical protein
MPTPVLFRDRPLPAQIILGGVIPAMIGAVAGILVGVSAAAYWVIAVLAGVGAFVAGFEHRDGWGGADRGMVGGVIYGVALLLVHALVGTQAKVSLGSFPPPAGGHHCRVRRSARGLRRENRPGPPRAPGRFSRRPRRSESRPPVAG